MSINAERVADLQSIWKDYRPTRLIESQELARLTGVGRVLVKAEWERPFGNFKALGGMVAGLRALARVVGAPSLHAFMLSGDYREDLPTLICASEGNHGLAVTAAAQRAGTQAVVYLSTGVHRSRADRIEALGGKVVWIIGTYDDAVQEAAAAASHGAGLLIPDTSDDPRNPVILDVMDGYAVLAQEILGQIANDITSPTHQFIQAGVGGLAAAMANGLQTATLIPPKTIVVEPQSAGCVAVALSGGQPERLQGDLRSSATMLSCGLASASAVELLRNHKAQSILVTELELRVAMETLQRVVNPCITSSGAAGYAGLLHATSTSELRERHGVGVDSTVLLIATEAAQ